MKRLSAAILATFVSWLIATLIYLVLTLPLEWSEWFSLVNAVNKIISVALGHGIYAVLIFVLGLLVSFRGLCVRASVGIMCITLTAVIFGVTGGDNRLDWLRAIACWIAAASMPFTFYAAHSRLSIAREAAAH